MASCCLSATCSARTDEPSTRPASAWAISIGFYLSSVIAPGIIFIGGRFLLAPSLAAAGYGVPAGTEPHSRAYLFAKGIRDIASGLFAVMLAANVAHSKRPSQKVWRMR